MASSRDNNKKRHSNELSLDDACLVKKHPYPNNAKPAYNYFCPLRKYEDEKAILEGRSSSHTLHTAVKVKDHNDIERIRLDYLTNKKIYAAYHNINRFFHIKNHPNKLLLTDPTAVKVATVPELEAMAAGFCRFLAPENVPAVHAIYEEDWFSLISLDQEPTVAILNDLPIYSEKAFVRVKGKLYFVNREKKECKLLKNISHKQMFELDTNLKTYELDRLEHRCRQLSCAEVVHLEKAAQETFREQHPNNKQSAEAPHFTATVSENIKDFKTNHEDPLKESDIQIELMNPAIEAEIKISRDKVNHDIKKLKKHLKKIANRANSYWELGKNFLVSNIKPDSSRNLKDFLKIQKTKDDQSKYSIQSIDELLETLRNRAAHIKDDKPNHKQELPILKECCADLQKLRDLSSEKEVTNSTNKDLEEAYRYAKRHHFDLSNPQKDQEVLNCGGFLIKQKDLKNYRIVKRLAVALVTRYLMQDTDNHNQNMSKEGSIIDFDMALLPVLYPFRDPNFYDSRYRKPGEHTFDITARDIINFPNLEDADFYYWPTRQTMVNESVRRAISTFVTLKENFFGEKDNEVFKMLAKHPVFIFHKYKTLLKYALFDVNMLREIAKDHIREDATYPDKVTKVVPDTLLKQEARIARLREVLITIPAFYKFLKHNGDYVMELLKEEFNEYRAKYENRNDGKDYSSLINAIDINKIENTYKMIFNQTAELHQNKDLESDKIESLSPIIERMTTIPTNAN